MRRAWIAIALLSASWLFGMDYYHHANWPAWAVLVALGTALLTSVDIPRLSGRGLAVTAAMTVPAVWLMPWPYRVSVLLVLAGALLCALPIPRRSPARLGAAGIATGVILLAQSLGIIAYEGFTARSHELPQPLAYVVYGVTRLLGIDATLDGTTLALHSMRRVHHLGATWELLLDPATWSFLLGAAAMLFLRASAGQQAQRWRGSLKLLAVLAVAIALWLPIRAGLLIALLMHRTLRTEFEAPLTLMNQFWSPWIHLALLLAPVLLAMRFVRPRPGMLVDYTVVSRPKLSRRVGSATLLCIGVLLITASILWDPSGPRKQGRVLVDEHHSTWERTDRPYEPNWYGQQSGYNYACIYDYCSRFYEMGRLNDPIDANTLDDCDVLVVKVPTSRYAPDEIAHIERFVRKGGGLLLIGEHTTVFNTGLYLNDIAQQFGLRFRYDCLFHIDDVFHQVYRPPLASHPIVQHMPPMDFAVSCSIDPGLSAGRAAIRSTGLRSLPADYHASNFYPQVEDRADARYGAFVQLWTTRRGAGRVAAFSDSTIFSNFSTFEPGKPEFMLGMLEWLNRRNASFDARPLLLGLGVALSGAALALSKRWSGSHLVLLGAGVLGWSLAVASVQAVHHKTYPAPQPVRPFTRVVIDRTVCDAPLSRSGFIAGEPTGFGIFERWILRLGCFTCRQENEGAFTGDLVVFCHPNRPVSPEFRTALRDYVANGGKALILDSPANAQSTANLLLHPFGLTVERSTSYRGTLSPPEGWPSIPVDSACQVKGGVPLIRLGTVPVAATAQHGQGSITVIGFASRFTDRQMGVTGDVIPDPQLRAVYELQFALLRSLLPNRQ